MEQSFSIKNNSKYILRDDKIIFTVEEHSNTINISGDTIRFRKLFKMIGGKFVLMSKSWKFTDSRADNLNKFLDLFTDLFRTDLKIFNKDDKQIYEIMIGDDFIELFLRLEEKLLTAVSEV